MDTRATSAATSAGLRVVVKAFARARELLGCDTLSLELPSGSTVAAIRPLLIERAPAFADIASSTRVARNGSLARLSDALNDGDEIALLPPVGGG